MTNDDYSYLQHESIRTDARNQLLSELQSEVEKLERWRQSRYDPAMHTAKDGEFLYIQDVLDLLQRLKGEK